MKLLIVKLDGPFYVRVPQGKFKEYQRWTILRINHFNLTSCLKELRLF